MYSERGRYVINTYISREISIEHPSVGLASLAQLSASPASSPVSPPLSGQPDMLTCSAASPASSQVSPPVSGQHYEEISLATLLAVAEKSHFAVAKPWTWLS